MTEMKPWEILDKKTVYHPNKFLKVELHKIKLPDGRIIDDWGWIILPDFANVVARNKNGKFLIFRQTKYAVGTDCLAIPGGFIESNEEPIKAAQRELLEETGYSSNEWIKLGEFVVDANRGAGRCAFFLALDCEKTSEPIPDDLEEQELQFLSLDELKQALDSNQFKALPWAASVALAIRTLEKFKK